MKRALLLYTLCVLFFCANSQQTSTRGKEFWMTFMENNPTNSIVLSLHFSAFQNSVVTITNPNTSYSQTLTVNANTLVSLVVPNTECYNTGSGAIANKVLKITATTEITMYALDYSMYTTDGTVILPVQALGVNYRIISYQGLIGYPSEFCLVATKDTTIIKITPSCNTLDNKIKGVPYYITLNKGQSYQVQSKVDSSLTGSLVEVQNCKPIAVYGGSVCSNVPGGNTCPYCDHLYEQLYPINMWGKEYILVPTATRTKDRFVILADQNATQLTINGVPITIALAGGTYEADINSPQYIQSSKPVCVALYAEGQLCAGGFGDPMMMWVSPLEQGIDSIIFVAQNSAVIDSHYVNIVAKTSTLASVKLNGVSIGAIFSPVAPNTAYSYIKKHISSGTNTITSDSGFTAYAYGYGNFESYGYNVGSSIHDLNRFFTVNGYNSDNYSTASAPLKLCKNSAVVLSGNSGSYVPLFWHWKFNNDTTSGQNVIKSFPDTGLVHVLMITSWVGTNLCSPNDTTLDTVSMYIRIIGPQVNIITPDTAVCRGSSFQVRISFFGDSTVTWSANSDLSCTQCVNPVITPSSSGWYKVTTVGNLLGCVASDSIFVHIIDSIQFVISGDTLICAGQKAQIKATLLNKDTSTHYIYKLYSNSVFIRQDTSAIFTETLDTTKTFVIKVNNGCSDAISTPMTVFVRTPLHVQFTDSFLICRNNNNSFTFSASGGDSSYTIFLLENNTIIDSINNATPSINYSFTFTPNPIYAYRILLTDGCTKLGDTATIHFRYRLPLSFTHTNDTLICVNQMQLQVTPWGGDSTYTFYLLKNNLVIDSIFNATIGNTNFFTISPLTSTLYKIVLKDGCTIVHDTQAVSILVRNPLSLIISHPPMICRGQFLNMNVTAAGGDSTYDIYLLNNNIVIDSVKNATPTTSYNFTQQPTPTANYRIVLRDGCTLLHDTQSVPFSFRAPLTFTHSPDSIICIGPFPIRVTPFGGDSSYTFYLLKNNSVIDSIRNATLGNSYSFLVSPRTTTSYTLVLKDGCTLINDTQLINLTVRDSLHFTHTPDTTICLNQVQLHVTPFGGDSTYSIYLTANNLIVDSIQNATIGNNYFFSVSPIVNTTFKIILKDGCTALNDTQTLTVTVKNPLSFTHSPDTMICIKQFQLEVTPLGGNGIYVIYLLKNNIRLDSIENAIMGNNYAFTILPSVSTIYTLVLKDGCTLLNDTQYFTILVRNPLSIISSNSSIICRGQNLNITVTPSGGDSTYTLYLLNNNIVIDSITNATPGVPYNFNPKPAISANYRIVLMDGCTNLNDTQSIIFSFRDALSFTRTPNQTICIGQSQSIQVVPFGGDSTYSFYLLKNNVIIDSMLNTTLGNNYYFTQAPTTTTQYTIVLKDGCTILNDSQKITIFVRNALKLSTTKDTIICRGQKLAITSTPTGGDSTYALYLFQGALCIDSIKNALSGFSYIFNVSPIAKTQYKIVLKDGCTKLTDSNYITIDLHAPLSVKATTSKIKICFKDSVTISALASGGLPNATFSYLWNKGAGNKATTKVSPPQSGWFLVRASDGCSTPAYDSIYIEVEPLPIVDFVADNTSGCEPFTTQFTNNSTALSGSTYWWKFGDGSTDNSQTPPSHTYVKPGSYKVVLIVTSPLGCIDSMVQNSYITVYSNPQITLKIDPKKVKLNNGKISFITSFKFTDDYDFDFGDGKSVNTEPITNNVFAHIYTDTGYFVVKLVAHNNFGCFAERSDTLFIEDYYTVFIPNVFSPTKKDGVNDYFRPVSTFTKRYDMTIYDRWGNFVYSETCEGKWYNCKGWDGTVNNQPVLEDNYIYLITLFEEDGQRHYVKGTFIILK